MLIDIYRRDLFCTIMHGGRAFFPWMGDIGTNLILAPPPRTTAIYGCGGGRRKGERRLFCLHGRRRNILFFGSSNRGRSNTREKNGMPFIGRFVRESLLPLLRQRAFEIHYHGGNGGPTIMSPLFEVVGSLLGFSRIWVMSLLLLRRPK